MEPTGKCSNCGKVRALTPSGKCGPCSRKTSK